MTLDPLSQVMHRFEDQPRWRSQQQFRQVLSCWSQVVGEAVACQAKPTYIERQVLQVTVANPMWGQTLTLERLRILAGLNQHLSIKLKDLRFSSGAWGLRSRQQPSPGSQTQSALPPWLRQHPSYDPGATPTPISGQPPQTALESFQRWAAAVQQADQHQPTCPVCRCHCPAGELKRWSVCGLCVVKQWWRGPRNQA